MRNFKKFLTLVLAVMMIVSSVAFTTSAATTKFEDVDANNEALVKAVDLLAYMGVAKGKSETNFGADEAVTREQFALFMYRLMKGGKDAPSKASNTTKFTDLEDPTYFYAISWANAEGIVNGKSKTTFAPKDGITLQEAYTMVVRALDWEKEEKLIYPFGYITVAEQDGVELDAGLSSDLDYTTELTRGDMAIILYNAFFAETGNEEVKMQVLNAGTNNMIIKEIVDNPRLCEVAYDVTEVVYEVKATPFYGEGTAVPTNKDFGEAMLYLEKSPTAEVNVNAGNAPEAVYLDGETLGLEKDADEYFLGNFTLFVTTEEVNNKKEIKKVLFSDCNMVKETVSKLTLGEVASNKVGSYYNYANAPAKLLSGKITAVTDDNAVIDMYAFNAPYTYAQPEYDNVKAEYLRYNMRNAKNLKTIDFSINTALSTGDDTYYSVSTPAYLVNTQYVAQIPATAPATGMVDDATTNAANYAADEATTFAPQARDLVEDFEMAYYDGLYEADIWDVDGDGIYDYIDYKELKFFQVSSDSKKKFAQSTFSAAVPVLYTSDANVVGADFEDEDYVIGYFERDLKLVDVKEVIKPTVAALSNFDDAEGKIVLSNGDIVDVVNGYRVVENIASITTPVTTSINGSNIVLDAEKQVAYEVAAKASRYFNKNVITKNNKEYYVYNGVLLYDGNANNDLAYAENLVIPTTLGGTKPVEKAFNVSAGESVYYIYAFVDGKPGYIAVETEDVYPVIVPTGTTTLSGLYDGQLCTYTEKDGVYTLSAYAEAQDELGAYIGMNKNIGLLTDTKDSDIYYIAKGINNVTINKVGGTRFDLINKATGLAVAGTPSFDLTSTSKIIIRTAVQKTGAPAGTMEYDYVTYDASNFTKSLHNNVTLNNVTYILSNNTKSTARENLVVLYGEYTGNVKFAGTADKDGYRIVASSRIDEDANGDWRNMYTLYNPYTGEKETNVPGAETSSRASAVVAPVAVGTMVELVDGEVDKTNLVKKYDQTTNVAALTTPNDRVVVITEANVAEGYITVAPYASIVDTCKDCMADKAERYAGTFTDIYGDVVPKNYLEVDKNTSVVVISGDHNGAANLQSFWNWGSISASTFEALANPSTDMLGYKEISDANGNLEDYYADFVKAYVSVDYTLPLQADEYPTVEYVIVLVDDNEALAGTQAAAGGLQYCATHA